MFISHTNSELPLIVDSWIGRRFTKRIGALSAIVLVWKVGLLKEVIWTFHNSRRDLLIFSYWDHDCAKHIFAASVGIKLPLWQQTVLVAGFVLNIH
jgi:hypothetical protein